MKLSRKWFGHQVFPQDISGPNHVREILSASFLTAWLNTVGSFGVYDKHGQWTARWNRRQPPQHVDETDPMGRYVLPLAGGLHDRADEIVDDRKQGQFSPHARFRLTSQHVHAERGFQMGEVRFNGTAILPPNGEVGCPVARKPGP